MRNDKLRLHFSTTFGTNGQIRLVESTGTNEAVFGFMYAQQLDDGSADFFQFNYRTISSAVTSDTDNTASLADGVYRGKVRNTFGKYAIVNKNMHQLEIWGYDYTDDDNIAFSKNFETTYDSSIQFMGSHEVYWFPYMQFMMARLSDGRTYKYFRMTQDF